MKLNYEKEKERRQTSLKSAIRNEMFIIVCVPISPSLEPRKCNESK